MPCGWQLLEDWQHPDPQRDAEIRRDIAKRIERRASDPSLDRDYWRMLLAVARERFAAGECAAEEDRSDAARNA